MPSRQSPDRIVVLALILTAVIVAFDKKQSTAEARKEIQRSRNKPIKPVSALGIRG